MGREFGHIHRWRGGQGGRRGRQQGPCRIRHIGGPNNGRVHRFTSRLGWRARARLPQEDRHLLRSVEGWRETDGIFHMARSSSGATPLCARFHTLLLVRSRARHRALVPLQKKCQPGRPHALRAGHECARRRGRREVRGAHGARRRDGSASLPRVHVQVGVDEGQEQKKTKPGQKQGGHSGVSQRRRPGFGPFRPLPPRPQGGGPRRYHGKHSNDRGRSQDRHRLARGR
mmetsp:Transcript_18256/g.33926  ORF Transcript_18256/g.33926 Transcript_18256/m.33926 type:complete len:229 (+) Transcript_18256:1235-1921(+)